MLSVIALTLTWCYQVKTEFLEKFCYICFFSSFQLLESARTACDPSSIFRGILVRLSWCDIHPWCACLKDLCDQDSLATSTLLPQEHVQRLFAIQGSPPGGKDQDAIMCEKPQVNSAATNTLHCNTSLLTSLQLQETNSWGSDPSPRSPHIATQWGWLVVSPSVALSCSAESLWECTSHLSQNQLLYKVD